MPRIDSLRPEQYERYKAYNREQYRIQKDREIEVKMRKIGCTKVRGWGDVPEVDTTSTDLTTLSTLINDKTEKIGQQLRKYVLQRFHQEQKGDCICIVGSRWVRAKKHIAYGVEITCFGGAILRPWLTQVVKDFGFEVYNYNDRRKKML